MNWRTIQRFESEKGFPANRTRNLLKIRRTLEEARVVFIDENGGGPGVQLRVRVSGPWALLQLGTTSRPMAAKRV